MKCFRLKGFGHWERQTCSERQVYIDPNIVPFGQDTVTAFSSSSACFLVGRPNFRGVSGGCVSVVYQKRDPQRVSPGGVRWVFWGKGVVREGACNLLQAGLLQHGFAFSAEKTGGNKLTIFL